MSNYDFELDGVNINSQIYSKPKISLSSRDEFTYFSFYAKDLKLKVALSLEDSLTDTAFLKVKRNSETIATYYCKAKSIDKDEKNRVISISFQSEFARIKDVGIEMIGNNLVFVSPTQKTAEEILDRVVANVNNEANLTGYSWNAGNISSTEVKLYGNHPFLKSSDWSIDTDLQSGDFFYISGKNRFGNLTLNPNEYAEMNFTYDTLTNYLVTTTDYSPLYLDPNTPIPFVANQSVRTVSGQHYYKDTSLSVPFTDYICTYGEFSSFDNPEITYSTGDKVGDVLLDFAKISDSIITVLDKTIYFLNNSSNDVHDLLSNEALILNRREGTREDYDFSELSLSIIDSTSGSTKPILLDSLKYYYEVRFDTETPIYNLEILTKENFKVGFELKIDSFSYGRIVDVEYSTKDPNFVKVKTEKSEHYE